MTPYACAPVRCHAQLRVIDLWCWGGGRGGRLEVIGFARLQVWTIFHPAHLQKFVREFLRMQFFGLQLEASCLQWVFLLTVDNFSFFTYSWSFSAYSFSFLTYNWSFLAYSGKVPLIKVLNDCKQRNLTASKKTPTVSKKIPPFFLGFYREVSREIWQEFCAIFRTHRTFDAFPSCLSANQVCGTLSKWLPP